MDAGREDRPLKPQNRPIIVFINIDMKPFIRHYFEFSTDRGQVGVAKIRNYSTGVGRKYDLFSPKMVYFFDRHL